MRKFESTDIGAELLPILTLGLYRDPFDAIREYAQNGIDAGATELQVIITSNSVVVIDNGTGMSPDVASQAIRLGMSSKNPTTQVGFRGIGIYSALHLCDRLVIHTRDMDDRCSVVDMDFKLIRDLIAQEQKEMLKGKPRDLGLETVMSRAITVGDDNEDFMSMHGTMVVMKSLSTDMGDRLKDDRRLEEYIQSSIPLPFNPDFRWKDEIESKLSSYNLKNINFTIESHGSSRMVYRPYTNDIFNNNEGEKPAFLEVKDTSRHYGICWYCANDTNNVLINKSLRGLLIKKQGFSIGSRTYAYQYFARKVILDRITGEVIVSLDELLPNAARDEFEASQIRDKFHQLLIKLAKDISEAVDKLQNERKAKDVLITAIDACNEIEKQYLGSQGDSEKLLRSSFELTMLMMRVQSHKKTLRTLMVTELSDFEDRCKAIESKISELIRTNKAKRHSKVSATLREIRNQQQLQTNSMSVHGDAPPASLLDVVDQLGLSPNPSMATFIKEIDDQIIRAYVDHDIYESVLVSLLSSMEDKL